jgi:PST family polysaccharide transporter
MGPSLRLLRTILPHIPTFVSFNAIQAAQLLLPMLALPWLARALGPDAYGLCLYMGIISGIAALVMDWGFPFGAARDAAMQRGQEKAQGRILAGVISAKILLAIGCALGALLLSPLLPHALDYPGAYALAVLAGISRGLSPMWFFQGQGRGIQSMAVWDASSSALVLLLAFLCVKAPEHWPVYLLLLALLKGSTYIFLTVRELRSYRQAAISPRRGWETLKRHKTLFAGNLSTLALIRGTLLVLGYFLSPAQMGSLVTADKIVRAAASLNNPAMQTMFPEICAARRTDGKLTTRMLRLTFFGTAAIMACGASAIWLIAPRLVDFVLGGAYTDVTTSLRVMSLLIPLQACNDVLAGQILIPLGRDMAQTLIKATTALLGLPAAALLGHFYGLAGGACLPLLLQGVILLGLGWSVRRACPEFFRPENTEQRPQSPASSKAQKK